MELVNQIADFHIALKDLEHQIKNPQLLHNGREIVNFSMRPREAVANWMLCVALRHIHGDDITFGEGGDGILIDKKTGFFVQTEHVSAMNFPAGRPLPRGEERVLRALNHKIAKGPDYASGKFLIAFVDGAEQWYPNRVGRAIAGKHNFKAVFCVGLLTVDKAGYRYSVSQLNPSHSPTYEIGINPDFTDWSVTQLQ